jgi:hypothetical protein
LRSIISEGKDGSGSRKRHPERMAGILNSKRIYGKRPYDAMLLPEEISG